MFETNLGFRELPRPLLLDAHCILSDNGLVLLDAATDWRTRRNPAVAGPPHIRFYAGAHLVDDSGVVVGVVAVHDSYPKVTFSEEQIGQLRQAADDLMAILKTPYELITGEASCGKNCFSNTLSNTIANSTTNINGRNHKNPLSHQVPPRKEVDDLQALSVQLGRATSRGTAAVFEKDGLGGPYAPNTRLFVSMKDEESPKMTRALISESDRQKVIAKIANAGSLKLAADAVCKCVAISHSAELVVLVEVRMADVYTIAREYLPKSRKVDLDTFKHANKLTRRRADHRGDHNKGNFGRGDHTRSSNHGTGKDRENARDRGDDTVGGEYFQARMLGVCGLEYQIVDLDDALLKAAFATEFGVSYTNHRGDTKYNRGVLIPVHKSNTRLVHQGPRPDSKLVDVYLRYGGYIMGVFNRSGKATYGADDVSRMYDQVTPFRKLYLS